MSRESQSKIQVRYVAAADQLQIHYSKRGTANAVGLRVTPEILLGISQTGRVISWQIDDPKKTLDLYLDDPSDFALQKGFFWKKQLDQQQVGRMLDFPNDTAAFVSRWIIGYSSTPYERR